MANIAHGVLNFLNIQSILTGRRQAGRVGERICSLQELDHNLVLLKRAYQDLLHGPSINFQRHRTETFAQTVNLRVVDIYIPPRFKIRSQGNKQTKHAGVKLGPLSQALAKLQLRLTQRHVSH